MNPLWVRERLIALLIVGIVVLVVLAQRDNGVAEQPGNERRPVAEDSPISQEIYAETPPVDNDH